MNPILHQIKWDFRHIRVLWIAWLALLALVVFGNRYSFLGGTPAQVLTPLLMVAQSLGIFLLGTLLLARLMYATPFARPEAFWTTRPLTRSTLFAVKSILIISLLWFPAVLSQVLSWWLNGAGSRFLFWGSLHFAAFVLAILLLAAVWAALCPHFGSFLLCFALTGAWAALCGIMLHQLSERVAFFPIQPTPVSPTGYSAFTTSTSVLAMVLLAALMVAAWIIGGRGRSRRSMTIAVGVVAFGIGLWTSANTLWRVGFLARVPVLPETELAVTVLAAGEEPGPGKHLLWHQLAIEVPPKHLAWVNSVHGTLSGGGLKSGFSKSSNDQSATSNLDRAEQLSPYYPPGTRIATTLYDERHSLISRTRIPTGVLEGEVEVFLMEWRQVASLPFATGQRARRKDGGTTGIAQIESSAHTVETRIGKINDPAGYQAPSLFGAYSHRYTKTAYVLYHPDRNCAVRGNFQGGRGMSSGSLGMKTSYEELEFAMAPFGSPAFGDGELAKARLDIYILTPVAVSRSSFRADDWTAYRSRKQSDPLPGVTAVPLVAARELPENPSTADVDAYLESILFNIPSRLQGNEWRQIRDRIAAIGSEHLERLLLQLPVGEYAQGIVFDAIRDLASESHLPAFTAALERDPSLASLFLEKKWFDAGAPVLAKHLQNRQPLGGGATQAAVRIVATRSDPATYDDLRWHFLRAPNGHREMANVLKRASGFPADAAIAEAWNTVRYEFDNRRSNFAVLAAGLGDKEALRVAFVHYADKRGQEDLKLLTAIVRHPGGDFLLRWLHENFEALRFDPDERKWSVTN